MPKIKEERIIERVKKMPPLWIKCPKCHEILYSKEVGKTNRCSTKGCKYLFPYPVAKVLEVETLLKDPKSTYGKISKLALKMLDSIDHQNKKVAFLSSVMGLIKAYGELHSLTRRSRCNYGTGTRL